MFALAVAAVMVLAASSRVNAQAAGNEGKRSGSGVVVGLTLAGAGGGFTAGLFLGLHAFDDAINSDRKVWTSAIVGAVAGGIGGYLIGRAIRDARHDGSRTGETPPSAGVNDADRWRRAALHASGRPGAAWTTWPSGLRLPFGPGDRPAVEGTALDR